MMEVWGDDDHEPVRPPMLSTVWNRAPRTWKSRIHARIVCFFRGHAVRQPDARVCVCIRCGRPIPLK